MRQIREVFVVFPWCRRKGERKMEYGLYDTVEHIKITLFDLAMFLGFLISCTYVLTRSKDYYAYHLNELMVNLFVKKSIHFNVDKQIGFEKMTSITSWFEYMETIFFEGIHKDYAANDYTMKKSPLHTIESNIFLGPILVRQIRVNDSSCEVIPPFITQFDYCYGHYSNESEYRANLWLNTRWISEKHFEVQGELAKYIGPGYGFYFDADYETDLRSLRRLRDTHWIDGGTRLLAIEFSFYAPNMDYFCIIKLYTEIAPVGALLPFYDIRTYGLYRGFDQLDPDLQIALIFCLVFLIYSCLEELIGIYDQKLKYFNKKWNYVDMMIISCGWTVFWVLTERRTAFENAFKAIMNSPLDYLNLEELAYYEDIYRAVGGLAVFFIWIKLFKYIAINDPMQVFSATMARCANELISFGLMFLLIFVGFATFTYLQFGGDNFGFRSFKESFITMVKMSVGSFHYLALEYQFPILGPVFYLVYLIVVPYILINMFLAIIDDTYKRIKGKQLKVAPTYLGIFLKNMCRTKQNKIDIDNLAMIAFQAERKKKPKPTEYKQHKQNLIPEFFEVLDSEAGTIEQEVELLDLRITRNEEVFTKLSKGIDKLILKLSDYRRS